MSFEVLNILDTLHINRQNLRILHPRLDIENMPLLIFVNKGIEVRTHALTLEIIADTCGPHVAKAATFIVCQSVPFTAIIMILDVAPSVRPFFRERKYEIFHACFSVTFIMASSRRKATNIGVSCFFHRVRS